MKSNPSSYYDLEMVAAGVACGDHRSMVGGLWDELGDLQFDLLKTHGLEPENSLLDIGCGCLRGGVRFASYLNSGNYYGLDLNQSFLDAGRAELDSLGLSGKVPPENLRREGDFDLAAFGRVFDMAVAVSLFTHLPVPYLRICLERLAPVLKPGGIFCVSFFLLSEGREFTLPCSQTPEITSHPDRDPYHYRREDIHSACLDLPWTARIVGDWKHPRNQQLVTFELASVVIEPEDPNTATDHACTRV